LKSITIIVALILAVGLTGCGASEVMQSGPSSYEVRAQEGLLTGGWAQAQKDAITKATEYCTSKGQAFTLQNSTQGGVPGWTPLSSTVTFTCGADFKAQEAEVNGACHHEMESDDFAPLRSKMEIYRPVADAPPPFVIASNETFPTPSDRVLIAKWAQVRDTCIERQASIEPTSGTALQNTVVQQDRAFALEVGAKVGELVLALYDGKLTYGEFARKRYEIGRDGVAAQRQFRAAVLIADHDRRVQEQQLAQQQLQNNLIAWSAYMQTVNARQPQTVHVDVHQPPSINCISNRLGNFVDTHCN
jgi:hypothetical protein